MTLPTHKQHTNTANDEIRNINNFAVPCSAGARKSRQYTSNTTMSTNHGNTVSNPYETIKLIGMFVSSFVIRNASNNNPTIVAHKNTWAPHQAIRRPRAKPIDSTTAIINGTRLKIAPNTPASRTVTGLSSHVSR